MARHRDLVDKMRQDFEKMQAEQQAKHDAENREREDRHAKDIRERIALQEKTERDLN